MFTKRRDKMLYPSGNNNPEWFKRYKFYSITNIICPQTCVAGNYQHIIFIQFYIFKYKPCGVIIENFGNRHKFKKDTAIRIKQHAFFFTAILESKKSFTCRKQFNCINRFSNGFKKLCLIRFKVY